MEFKEVYERVLIMFQTGARRSAVIEYIENLYCTGKITSRMFNLLIDRAVSISRG